MQCACAILSSVACSALQYFSTLSHKRRDFRGGGTFENKMCTVSTSRNLSETFLILRIILQDIIINVHTFSRKLPVTIVRF